MKKLISLIAVIGIFVSSSFTALAATVFPAQDYTLKTQFTDTIKDEEHFVKYDEATDSIHAYSTSSNNQKGVLNFPTAISEDDSVIAFTFKARSESHSRARIYIGSANITGTNTYLHGRNGQVFLGTNTSSQLDTSFGYKDMSEEVRVEMKFNFTNQNYTVRLGVKAGGTWMFNSWIPEKAFAAQADSIDSFGVSNEYMVCDIDVYDIEVVVPDEEQPETPDTYDNPIYYRVCNENFDKESSLFSPQYIDDENYVMQDMESGKIHAYNGDNSGSQTGTITFDNALTADNTKVYFDFAANEGHQRMKIHFLNNDGKQIQTVFVLAIVDDEGTHIGLTDKNNSQFSYDLYKTEYNVPIRAELTFNFTAKTISVRTAKLTSNGYVYADEIATKPFSSASGGAESFNIKKIQIQNEYLVCDATIDNLEVLVPKLTVQDCSANADEYLITYTVVNNTTAPIATDIICAVYGEDGSVVEVKLLKNVSIDKNFSDMFMFDIEDDFSKYKLFLWDANDSLTPVSEGYSSF